MKTFGVGENRDRSIARFSLARLRERWQWLGTADRRVKERQRWLLHGLLITGLAILAVLTLLNVAQWFMAPSPRGIFYVVCDLLLALIFLGLLRLNRARYIPWVAYLFLIIATLSLSATFPIADLDRILIAYAVPTMAASFVIAPAASFVFALLSALSYSVAYWVGGAASSQGSAWLGYNYLAWLVLFVVALVSYLAADRLEQALREVQQREESLRETLQALQALVQASPLPIVALDTGSHVTIWNLAAERVFGWSEEEVLGRFNPLVPEDKKAEHVALYAQVLRGEDLKGVEVRRRKKDGTLVDLIIYTASLRNAQGDIIGAMGMMVDITERKRLEESLRASEAKYRTLFSHIADPVVIFDQETKRFLDCNQAAMNLYGYTREEFLAMTPYQLHPPEDWAQVAKNIDDRDDASPHIYTHLTKSGERLQIETHTAELDYEGRKAWVSIFRDVTARKKVEEALRQQNKYLAALHEMTLGLMNHLALPGLLEAILMRASQLLGTQHGFLYLVEPGDEHITIKVGIGIYKKYIGTHLQMGEGLSGKVWQSGRPLVVDDYPTWPGRSPKYDGDIFHAAVGVPLKAGPRVVGVFGLAYLEPGRTFGEAEVELLSRFAQLASVALDNARLFDAEREQRQLAEAMCEAATALSATLDSDAILNILLEQIARVIPCDAAFVVEVKDGRARAVRSRGYGECGEEMVRLAATLSFDLATTPNLRQVVESRQPLVIPDTATYPGWIEVSEHLRSWVGAPIVVDGDVVALLSLTKSEAGFYRPEHAERLAMFAGQAGLALQNARLFEEAHRHLREVSLLSWVIALTATAEDMTTALRMLCTELANFFHVPQAGFALLNKEHTSAQVVAEYRTAGRPSALGSVIPVAGNPSMAYILEHGVPLMVPDAQTDPLLAPVHDLMRQQGIVSILLVPIKIAGEVIGTLGLDSLEHREFSESEIALAQYVASQTAQMLERLRLYTVTREHAELMTRLALLSEELNHPFTVGEVAAAIGRGVLVLSHADRAAVFVRQPDGTASCPWAFGLSPEHLERAIGLAQKAMQEGRLRPLFIPDVEKWPTKPPGYCPAPEEGGRALGLWPLIYEGRVIAGVGCCWNAPRILSEAEREAMESFARQAAIALENARLYSSLQETNAQLQAAVHAKDEMIQNVSHELRTPLTHIKGYTELLVDGVLGELNADQYQAMATVNKKADALARLVNGLLTLQTFSAEELELGPVDVKALLQGLADDWGMRVADSQMQLEIRLADSPLCVHADAERLREALDQLLENAIKFSPADGGIVRLEAEGRGRMVRLAVSDNGIGIPADKLQAVFERFYQVDGSSKRRYGGAGIGLSLVQKIVEAHKGKVWVESPGWLGRGTTFVVEVPATNGTEPEGG